MLLAIQLIFSFVFFVLDDEEYLSSSGIFVLTVADAPRERERVVFGSDSLPRNTRQEQTLDECLGSYL